MRIEISIETDNQAFVDNFNLETRMVMEQAWEKIIKENVKERPSQMWLRDTNGNVIGHVAFRKDRDEVND